MKTTLINLLMSFLVVLGAAACMQTNEESADNAMNNFEYGVFLSLQGREAIDASENYHTVVIDAQNLSGEEIDEMQERGQEVYSYLNVGSLETFRPYYEEFQHLALKPYVNWENEFWVDASSEEWQEFVAITLANQLLEKGIDGFWIDNVDVYGQFPTDETYSGVEFILKTLMKHSKPVIVNGGDQFVRLYHEQNQHVDDILTGVNQETVFSAIHFEERELGTQSTETQNYYTEYIEVIEQAGKDIFLLEYTTDNELAQTIHDYADERGWKYYISDSIELDG